jgi:hypothetical protein
MRRAAAALALLGACSPHLGEVFVDAAVQPTCPELADGGVDCPLPPDWGPLGELFSTNIDRGADGAMIYVSPLCQPAHRLSVQLYPGHGVFPGDVAPGTYDLGAASEHSFATCGACVRLFQDVDAHGRPARTYLAASGQLVITDLGGADGERFGATLDQVTFTEVTIDPLSFATQPVGTCSSRIEHIEVQAAVRSVR